MVTTAVLVREALVDDAFERVVAGLSIHAGTLVLEVALVVVASVLTSSVPVALPREGIAEVFAILIIAGTIGTGADAITADAEVPTVGS